MLRINLRLLGGLCALVVLAACSGGGGASRSELETKMAAQLTEEGLSAKEATCFAGVLVAEIGVDKLKDVDFSADEPPAELQDEIIGASTKAIASCDIDASSLSN
ncbi:MAG: hypothetical protein WD691_01375 [Acidimicrobiales bacterium]